MANYHVTNPKGTTGWKVLKENAKRAATVVPTQQKAEKIAKQLSKNSGGGEVRIHKPQGGLIRDSDTIAVGNDPRSIKDRKH